MLDRRSARALELFGGAGLLIVVALVVAMLLMVGPLTVQLASLERQRSAAAEALASTSEALEATATAAEGASTSLASGEAALRDAAVVTRQLADATAGLAAFSSGLAETADRSRSLSEELSRTADGLHLNGAESQAMASRLRVLADELDALSASIGTSGGAPIAASLGLPIVGLLVALLLVWLGTASAACLVIGHRALCASTAAGDAAQGA